MVDLTDFKGIRSFEEFKEKTDCKNIAEIIEIIEQQMVGITKILSNVPEDQLIDCYVHLASKYCDGTEKRYDNWRKIISKCMKDPDVPKIQKEYLSLLD